MTPQAKLQLRDYCEKIKIVTKQCFMQIFLSKSEKCGKQMFIIESAIRR